MSNKGPFFVDNSERKDLPRVTGRVTILFISARDLPASDIGGSSDPYVEVTAGSRKMKTDKIKRDLNPEWRQEISIKLDRIGYVSVYVKDWDRLTRDDPLAYVGCNPLLLTDQMKEYNFPIKRLCGSKESPTMKVKAMFEPRVFGHVRVRVQSLIGMHTYNAIKNIEECELSARRASETKTVGRFTPDRNVSFSEKDIQFNCDVDPDDCYFNFYIRGRRKDDLKDWAQIDYWWIVEQDRSGPRKIQLKKNHLASMIAAIDIQYSQNAVHEWVELQKETRMAKLNVPKNRSEAVRQQHNPVVMKSNSSPMFVSPHQIQQRQQQQQQQPSPLASQGGMSVGDFVLVTHDFEARAEGQMSIREGDKVKILAVDKSGWWLVREIGRAGESKKKGHVPMSYLRFLKKPGEALGAPSSVSFSGGYPNLVPSPQQSQSMPLRREQCKAKFAYNPSPGDKSLKFVAGQVFDIISKDSSGWWSVVDPRTNIKGIIPSNYFEIVNNPQPQPQPLPSHTQHFPASATAGYPPPSPYGTVSMGIASAPTSTINMGSSQSNTVANAPTFWISNYSPSGANNNASSSQQTPQFVYDPSSYANMGSNPNFR